MSLKVVCDICGTEIGGANLNPRNLVFWAKDVKQSVSGKKFVLNLELRADASDADPNTLDFEHLCRPCGRDVAKTIVQGIINA